MKIYFGSDHAGFALKQKLIAALAGEGHEIKDLGDASPEAADDYPDFIFPAARAIAADPESRGIVIGGSGQGEAMAANRVRGLRAAVFYGGNDEIIKLSREHNDANVLSLGARFLSEEEALAAVRLWLATPFSGEERHRRRIAELDSPVDSEL